LCQKRTIFFERAWRVLYPEVPPAHDAVGVRDIDSVEVEVGVEIGGRDGLVVDQA
jgi:hypothetical protein